MNEEKNEETNEPVEEKTEEPKEESVKEDSEEGSEDEEEMSEVEIWEFSLDDEEIDELVGELQALKQTQTNFSFGIDEDNELLIHYEKEEAPKSSEEEDEEIQNDTQDNL